MTADASRTRDGHRLHVRRWSASSTPPRAQLLIVHGLGEHIGRYEHVARRFADGGFDVHGYDHRGFGASEGRRADVERWSHYHDDLEDRIHAIRADAVGLPLVVFAHSMGGLIALGYAYDPARPQPDLLALSAPGLGDRIAPWKRALAGPVSRVAPTLRIANGLDRDGLSRDEAVLDAVLRDPLSQSASTTRLGAAAFAEQRRVRDLVVGGVPLPMPTWVHHGDDDRIVPVAATEPLARLPGVTRRVWPELRHETHNEPEWPQVIDEVIGWLDAELAGLPRVVRPGVRSSA